MDSIFINLETFLKDAKQLGHITTHTNKFTVDQLLKSDMLEILEMYRLMQVAMVLMIKKMLK